jgi:hypothetical protein
MQPFMLKSGYYTAVVCTSGHMVNAQCELAPERNAAFCSLCGQPTISVCKECATPIRGELYGPGTIHSAYGTNPPAYCHECGAAYPWTSGRLAAAQEMARELESLSPKDRELLASSLPDIMIDGPGTELAASRVKRLLAKAGPAGAVLYKFATEVGAKVAAEIILSKK